MYLAVRKSTGRWSSREQQAEASGWGGGEEEGGGEGSMTRSWDHDPDLKADT